MTVKSHESDIVEFSNRIVRRAGLPYGSEIAFYRSRDGRRVRSDFVVKRRAINEKTFPVPGAKETVAKFLERVTGLLTTDLKARGIQLALFGPSGQLFDGHTHMTTVRALDGQPDPAAGSPAELFSSICENAGVELSIRQMGSLFRHLSTILGVDFEDALLKKAANIRRSCGS